MKAIEEEIKAMQVEINAKIKNNKTSPSQS
jgi:hypothetical protein